MLVISILVKAVVLVYLMPLTSLPGFSPIMNAPVPVVVKQAVEKPKPAVEVVEEKPKEKPKPTYRKVEASVTAYTDSVSDCGKTDGIAASGVHVEEGMIAAPAEVPFGTKVEINGKVYTVTDRGGAIKLVGDVYHFDIFVPSQEQSDAYGRKKMTVKIYY